MTEQDIICAYISGKSYKEIESRYNISHRQMEKIMKNFYEEFKLTTDYRNLLSYTHRTHKNKIPAKIVKKYFGWNRSSCKYYQLICKLNDFGELSDLYSVDIEGFMPFTLRGIECEE